MPLLAPPWRAAWPSSEPACARALRSIWMLVSLPCQRSWWVEKTRCNRHIRRPKPVGVNTAAPAMAPARQPLERVVGARQRIRARPEPTGEASRQGRGTRAVAASEIGDRADAALSPQQPVRECRDVAHVNPGADNGTAARGRCKRNGDQRPGGREDQRRIERRRRLFVAAARPVRADAPREVLRIVVAGPGECVDGASLRQGHLRDQVRGGAESVDTERAGVSRHRIGAIADQTGAQQRRRMQIVVTGGQRKNEIRIRDSEFRVAAVPLIAGETRFAQRFSRLDTHHAQCPHVAASHGTPTRVPSDRSGHAGAVRHDAADDFMPGYTGIFGSASSPSTTWRSVRQTPHARTSTSSSPAAVPARAPFAARAADQHPRTPSLALFPSREIVRQVGLRRQARRRPTFPYRPPWLEAVRLPAPKPRHVDVGQKRSPGIYRAIDCSRSRARFSCQHIRAPRFI